MHPRHATLHPTAQPACRATPPSCVSNHRVACSWRYTEWAQWDGTKLRPNWGTNAGIELYDHRGDDETSFDATENFSVHKQNPDVVAALSKQLHKLVTWHDIDASPIVEDGAKVLSFDAAPIAAP